MNLTEYDYEFLTDTWDGAKGAAYNVVGEDLYEAGMIDDFGFVTDKGKKAIAAYEEAQKSYSLAVTDNGRVDVV